MAGFSPGRTMAASLEKYLRASTALGSSCSRTRPSGVRSTTSPPISKEEGGDNASGAVASEDCRVAALGTSGGLVGAKVEVEVRGEVSGEVLDAVMGEVMGEMRGEMRVVVMGALRGAVMGVVRSEVICEVMGEVRGEPGSKRSVALERRCRRAAITPLPSAIGCGMREDASSRCE